MMADSRNNDVLRRVDGSDPTGRPLFRTRGGGHKAASPTKAFDIDAIYHDKLSRMGQAETS